MINNKGSAEFAKIISILVILIFAAFASSYMIKSKDNIHNVTDTTFSLDKLADITGVPILKDRVVKFDALGELNQDFLKDTEKMMKSIFNNPNEPSSGGYHVEMIDYSKYDKKYTIEIIDDGVGLQVFIVTLSQSTYPFMSYTQDPYSYLKGKHLTIPNPNVFPGEDTGIADRLIAETYFPDISLVGFPEIDLNLYSDDYEIYVPVQTLRITPDSTIVVPWQDSGFDSLERQNPPVHKAIFNEGSDYNSLYKYVKFMVVKLNKGNSQNLLTKSKLEINDEHFYVFFPIVKSKYTEETAYRSQEPTPLIYKMDEYINTHNR